MGDGGQGSLEGVHHPAVRFKSLLRKQRADKSLEIHAARRAEVETLTQSGTVRETQLFNLKENPHEYLEQNHDAKVIARSGAKPKPNQRNLAKDPAHSAKLKEMESLLLSEMKRLDDPHRLWDQEEK